jgi:hypothetical protein
MKIIALSFFSVICFISISFSQVSTPTIVSDTTLNKTAPNLEYSLEEKNTIISISVKGIGGTYKLNSNKQTADVENLMRKYGQNDAADYFKKGIRQQNKSVIANIAAIVVGLGLVGYLDGQFSNNQSHSSEIMGISIAAVAVALPTTIVFGIITDRGRKKVKKSLELYNEGISK